MSDIKEDKPKIDTFDLYKRNVKGTFKGGFLGLSSVGLVVGFFHILFLPFTLTVGAAMKTFSDVMSRRPLSNAAMNTLQKQITDSDDKDIDRLAKNVVAKYQELPNQKVKYAKSNSSKALIKCLQDAEKKELDDIEEFSKARKLQTAKEAIESAQINQSDPAMKKVQINVMTYELSKEQNENVEAEINTQKAVYHQNKINVQRAAIFGFLKDKKNIGKNTQHVIKTEMDNIIIPKLA